MVSEKTAPVAVVMGSDSDMKFMKSCIEQLGDFGIEPVVRIISAHRTPEIAADFAENAAGNGIKVIIAAAGMAAHLAGAMAAKVTRRAGGDNGYRKSRRQERRDFRRADPGFG